MSISEQDNELLSAYLDEMLEASQRAQLEARLNSDSELSSELNALRQTIQLVKALPELPAPRSYTLTPEQALRIRSERSRPAAAESKMLRFVLPVLSAVASMALVLFGLSLLLSAPNGTPPVENIAGLSTPLPDTGSFSRLGVTPTLAQTLPATEGEVAEMRAATAEEEPLESVTDADEELTDQAESADTAADAAQLTDSTEEAADSSLDQMFLQPSATLTPGSEAGSGAATAFTTDDEAAADMFLEAPSAAAILAGTLTYDGERPALAQGQALPSATATLTLTASITPPATLTALAPAMFSTAVLEVQTPGDRIDESFPPSQLVGLILLGFGLSLAVITLVLARRASRL